MLPGSLQRGMSWETVSDRALSLLEKAFLIPCTAKRLPAQPHGVSGTGHSETEASVSSLVEYHGVPHTTPDFFCLESKGDR